MTAPATVVIPGNSSVGDLHSWVHRFVEQAISNTLGRIVTIRDELSDLRRSVESIECRMARLEKHDLPDPPVSR